MKADECLFEKACRPMQGLTTIANCLPHIAPGTELHREVGCYLRIAIRHGLEMICGVCETGFHAEWVERLLQRGRRYWDQVAAPALARSLYEPEPSDPEEPSGPPEYEAGQSSRSHADRALLSSSLSTIAALLDLREAMGDRGLLGPGGLGRPLVPAFEGATRVVSDLLTVPWERDWGIALYEVGRHVVPDLVGVWSRNPAGCEVTAESLAPLDEAWLDLADPERTAEAEREGERRRRRDLTPKTCLPGDFLPAACYARADLARLHESPYLEHAECVAWAKAPRGLLVLRGEFDSALHWIQCAIGRHWFVDQMETVRAEEWYCLVRDNLLAQSGRIRCARRLVIHALCPLTLDDGRPAHPGLAERLLAHRLRSDLPTIVTTEYRIEELNLRPATAKLLQGARTIVLPSVAEVDLATLGITP